MDSSHQFDLEFKRFEQEMDKNTKELEEKVRESRKLTDEISTWQKSIEENKRKISQLKPLIERLERDKLAHHRQLQQLEERNRARVNEHLVDKSKMIRPFH